MSSNQLNNCIVTSAVSSDLPAITELCVAAFTRFEVFGPPWNSDAGVLPAILSGFPESSLDLSRLAYVDGTLAGHALWGESSLFLAGRFRRAAHLAPLSVHPDWQRKGVGGALMRDGIELLRQRGVSLLYILGHDFYYPRFGLKTGCYGRHALSTNLPPALAADPDGWRLRPLACGDEHELMTLWSGLCATTDGACLPDKGLLPWCSKTKGIIAAVLEHEGRICGYVRADIRPDCAPESRLLRFLAVDAQSATILLARLRDWAKWIGETITIPLPPNESAVRALFSNIEPVFERWSAGMCMVLDHDQELESKLERIQSGAEPPLFIEWSNAFDW